MQNTFGEFLCQKRKENNLTQKELAEKLYVSESAVCKWEKDIARPDIALLPKLAQILNVTEHELITARVDEVNKQRVTQAKKWNTMITWWNMSLLIGYGLTILTCFIVNIVVSQKLDWFFIVFTAVLLSASFTNLPKYINKHKLLIIPSVQFLCYVLMILTIELYTAGGFFWYAVLPVLITVVSVFLPIITVKYKLSAFLAKHIALFVTTIVYVGILIMLAVFNLISQGKWFVGIALPLTSYALVATVVSILIIKYTELVKLLKIGLNMLLFTAIFLLYGYTINPLLTNAGVDMSGAVEFSLSKANFAIWEGDYITHNITLLTTIILFALTAIYLAIGIAKQIKSNKNK